MWMLMKMKVGTMKIGTMTMTNGTMSIGIQTRKIKCTIFLGYQTERIVPPSEAEAMAIALKDIEHEEFTISDDVVQVIGNEIKGFTT
jgi:hypothetical protein